MKRAFLIVLIAVSCTAGFSQELPNLIPPSPEATSLMKFSEVPVSQYTGLANVSLPIYNIQLKELNLPISLSYHSRGIKVEEIASRVGLGWALNAGGKISRQVRGRPDDLAYGYLKEDFYADFFTNATTRTTTYDAYVNHGIDMDPDLFFFQFGNNSGQFIFDQVSKKVLLQTYDDVIIEPKFSTVNGKIEGFEAIDDMGNTYYFGIDPDTTGLVVDQGSTDDYLYKGTGQIVPTNTDRDAHINTWHLTKINTYFDEDVFFDYELEGGTYYRRSYDKVDLQQEMNPVVSYFSKVKLGFQRQLTGINYPGGRIEFISKDSVRKDLQDSYALDRIEIFNRNEENIENYKFSYDYQTSTATGNELPYLITVDPTALHRLFLKSMTKYSGGEEIPPYRFEYSDVKIPNRFSNSQDNWGYFNGADNGHYLTFFDYGSTSVDRTVDTVMSEAGLLKKLHYPTGGSTEFEYEHNIGQAFGEKFDMIFKANNPTEQKGITISKLDGNYNGNFYSKQFTVGPNVTGNGRSSVSFTMGDCEQGDYTPDCRYTVSLHDNNSSNFSALSYGDNNNWSIPSGSYTLKVTPNVTHDPQDFNDAFIVSLDWQEQIVSDNNLIYAGGKRIKSIRYLNNGEIVKSKKFKYTVLGTTTGIIHGFPNFYSVDEVLPTGITVLKPYGSVPGSPLTSLQGNSIGYTFVEEFDYAEGKNLGKTLYEFTNLEDQGDYYKFPHHLPINNEWLRGKNKKIRYYKSGANNDFKVLREVVNNYKWKGEFDLDAPFQFTYTETQALIDRKKFIIPLAVFAEGSELGGFSTKTYHQVGGTINLSSRIEKFYNIESPSDTPEMTRMTEFEYDYDNHYKLAREIMHIPEGKRVKEYLYPNNVTSVSALESQPELTSSEYNVIDQLKTIRQDSTLGENRFNLVQQNTKFIDVNDNSHFLSTERTYFNDFSSLILPSEVKTAKGNNNLETRVQFHQYDPKGNLVEVSLNRNTKKVYLWGNDRNYPLAVLENTTYNQALTALDLTSSTLPDTLNDNQRAILYGLPNTQVQIFNYKSGVGIRKIYDQNGYYIQYEYDDLNRLITVKDSNESLLRSINYNFKKDNP